MSHKTVKDYRDVCAQDWEATIEADKQCEAAIFGGLRIHRRPDPAWYRCGNHVMPGTRWCWKHGKRPRRPIYHARRWLSRLISPSVKGE